jgi:hypothetical protein
MQLKGWPVIFAFSLVIPAPLPVSESGVRTLVHDNQALDLRFDGY